MPYSHAIHTRLRYKLGHLAPVPASHFSPHFLPHIDSLSECGIRTARSSPSPALQSPPTPPRLRLTFDAAAADITPIWTWFPRPLFFIKPPTTSAAAPSRFCAFRGATAVALTRKRVFAPRNSNIATCGATQVLYLHIQAQTLVPMPKILMALSLPIWSKNGFNFGLYTTQWVKFSASKAFSASLTLNKGTIAVYPRVKVALQYLAFKTTFIVTSGSIISRRR
ncbi:hypothetical protein C8R43DRAFT_1236382 [Mycena crocata]|nr:hypothetical protein C8R43DRAFT_1236382 [Mycena crocata]